MLSCRKDYPPPLRMTRNLGPTFPAFRKNYPHFVFISKGSHHPRRAERFLSMSSLPQDLHHPEYQRGFLTQPYMFSGSAPGKQKVAVLELKGQTNKQTNRKRTIPERKATRKTTRDSRQRREPSARKPCQQSGALTFPVSGHFSLHLWKREVGNASRKKALGPPTGLNKLYLQINHLEWGRKVGTGSLEESKSLASLLFPSP